MSKGPDDGLRIGAAAGYGPRVPYLTPGARVDLGPAGSLIQAQGVAADRADLPPAGRTAGLAAVRPPPR